MVVLLPYPNGITYPEMEKEATDIFKYADEIREYVGRVCKGPWTSSSEDVLQAGLRIRLGNEKDLFMLTLKYGTGIVKNV